jgi:hypothetical protein
MGVLARDRSCLVLVVVCLILSVSELCNCGITSSYVRNDDLSLDMPLDSDVFRVPPGYNAPQQVCFCFCIKSSCLSITFIPGISFLHELNFLLIPQNGKLPP